MDRKAFDELVEERGPSIYRLCKAYCGASDELDDVYQEVLINIWKAISKFRGDSSLSTWIYRVTVNTAISHLRKQKSRPSGTDDMLESLEYDTSDLIYKQEREQQYNQLLNSIEQLKPEHRVIIGLYLEDLSYKEIAEIIGKDTNYVGVNIGRIKQKLTKLMQYG
ncbi:RNA polymerase sigma factor [Marinoscillum sp.]|uniref:RNA polymerase sigma factor n=1 Tax=Marinoscillum sp. TaxID=2024838 RepID=UPI003BABA4D3